MNTAEKIRANHLNSPIRSKAVPEAPMADEISPEQDENGSHSSTKPVSARLERIDKYLANAPKWRYALFFFKAADLVNNGHISQVTWLTLATWLYQHTDKTLEENGVDRKGYDLEEAYKELYDQWTLEGNTKCEFYLEWADGFKEFHKQFRRNSHGYEFDWWFFDKCICTVNDLADSWVYGIDVH
jgi:hypothetical protein